MHLRVPITRTRRSDGTVGMSMVEQDGTEEVDACVFAVLNTPTGHLLHLPEFGTPRMAFRRGGADLAALERAVALWEPRVDLIAMRETGRLDELAARMEAGQDVVQVEV